MWILLAGFSGLLMAGLVWSQVGISYEGLDVRINADGSVSVISDEEDVRVESGGQVSSGFGNKVQSSVGKIAPDANIEGVTIINGKLWIDGKEVPPNVKRYVSPKTGKLYNIERRGDSVSVTSNE